MSRRPHNAMLVAAMLSMVAGSSVAQSAMPAPRKGGNRDYRPKPKPPACDTLAREIAEWNEQVEARKAEKRARKAKP